MDLTMTIFNGARVIFFTFLFGFLPIYGSLKAIIFDCDGVLVETEGLKFQAWQEVLQPHGIILSEANYQSAVGHTSLHILKHLSDHYQIPLDPSIAEEKNAIYTSLQKTNLQAIEPMQTVLQWARAQKEEKGLRLAVATSASTREVTFNLNFLKVRQMFDVILSGKDDLTMYTDPLGVNKPQPYIYTEACLRLGLDPAECLVFEDSEPGVCAAKRAGCKVIAIPRFWTAHQNFENADLILINPNSDEIIRAIEGF